MEFKITNLSKTIGDKKIFENVNFSLKKGDILALKGSNGSGKTTLLKIIAGLDKEYKGEVSFSENAGISYVPQDIVLFEKLNVKDNLKAFCNGKNAKEAYTKLEGYAKELGLSELFKKRVDKLSGGQKRLVNFVIGFANSPALLLLDEVIVGMDEATVKRVVKLLNDVKADKIMIITSHQEEFIEEVCNLSARLIAGKLEFDYEN